MSLTRWKVSSFDTFSTDWCTAVKHHHACNIYVCHEAIYLGPDEELTGTYITLICTYRDCIQVNSVLPA